MTRHEDRKAERMEDPEFAKMYEVISKDIKAIVKDDTDKETPLTPAQKIAREKADIILTQKAEERDPNCWTYGCPNKAHKWVREIQFDVKGDKVGHNQSVVDTRDFSGPVPGFCWGHDSQAPMALAEAVYNMKEEFKWGLPATRWWVVYTDGTKTGGEIKALNLGPGYTVKEDYTPGSH